MKIFPCTSLDSSAKQHLYGDKREKKDTTSSVANNGDEINRIKTMKIQTRKINGQKFARITYGATKAVAWYPIENLRWLSARETFTLTSEAAQ